MKQAARTSGAPGAGWRTAAARLWHVQRIKRLLRARLAADAVISVVELPCDDPACSGPATRITVLGFDLIRRVLVVHRPAAEIAAADLDALAGRLSAGPDPGLT